MPTLEDKIQIIENQLARLKEDTTIGIQEAKNGLSPSQKWEMVGWLVGVGAGSLGLISLILGFIFNSVAETTARQTAETVAVERITDRIRRDTLFIEAVQQGINVVPPDAVMAFASVCPEREGWKLYPPATARFLIGAGSEFHPKHKNWDQIQSDGNTQGKLLSTYPLHESGGEESVILTTTELASHHHNGTIGNSEKDEQNIQFLAYEIGADGQEVLLKDAVFDTNRSNFLRVPNKDHTHNIEINEEGDGVGHRNIPPFLALHFCIKE